MEELEADVVNTEDSCIDAMGVYMMRCVIRGYVEEHGDDPLSAEDRVLLGVEEGAVSLREALLRGSQGGKGGESYVCAEGVLCV